jgi:uncharacterized membrane protein YhaH (DUF805 family)
MNEAERFLQRYEQKKNEPPPLSPPSPPAPQFPQSPYNQTMRPASYSNSGSATAGLFEGWWSLSGRIGRQLYFQRWLVVLGGCVLFGAVLGLIGAVAIVPIFGLAAVPFMIPQRTRRLHDLGLSGWWQLVNHIPFIGWIFWLYIFVKEGSPGANQYGVGNSQEVYQ